jgi:hypothetical protein
MAQRGSRSLNLLKGAAANVGRGLDALGNRYTALLSGAAGAGTARQVINLQSRFTRLEIQAGATEERMAALRDRIYEAAQAPDIRVDPGEITSAIESIVEMTGDLDFAEANIRNIGLAIQASGAAGQDIGGILAEFQKMGIKGPDEVAEALGNMNEQGKLGAFTLKDLAALGPRVITAYAAMGRGGPEALLEMNAALQMIRMGTGSSEMAATAFEATMRTLADPSKLKLLERAGINVYENGVLRPINTLMAEIIQKSGGDKVQLGRIFDAEAVRAFNQATAEFKRNGSLDSLDKFMAVQAGAAGLTKDSARAAKDAEAAITSLTTAWEKFASSRLTGPIQKAADALNALGSEGADTLVSTLGYGAAGLGALVLGRKAYTGGRGLVDMFRGGKGGGAGLGGLGGLGGMKLPLPVYVVNSKMSLMPGEMGGGADFGGGGGNKGSRLGRALSSRGGRLGRLLQGGGRMGSMLRGGGRLLGRFGGGAVMGLGLGALDLANTWTDDSLTKDQKISNTAHSTGSMIGTVAGGALGSLLGPLGTVAGSMAGNWLGGMAGDLVGDWLTDDPAKAEPAKADLKVQLTAGPELMGLFRTSTTVRQKGFGDVDVDSGPYMMGVGE